MFSVEDKPFPVNGKPFLGYNKEEQEFCVLNCPPNCAIGKWYKEGKEWYGHSIDFEVTHWKNLPSIKGII